MGGPRAGATGAIGFDPLPALLSPMPRIVRTMALLACTLAWVWTRSPLTPWAVSAEPRMWLYDLLYYTGFVLLAWGLAEAGALWIAHRRGRKVGAPACLVAIAAVCGLLPFALSASGYGIVLQVRTSTSALAREIDAGDTYRHRAGALIIDSRRRPCGETWLWLGRPHGAGSGTSLALVHAGGPRPLDPDPNAFRYRDLGGGWWVAYQHGARYAAGLGQGPPARCTPAEGIVDHRAGMRFVAEGRG